MHPLLLRYPPKGKSKGWLIPWIPPARSKGKSKETGMVKGPRGWEPKGKGGSPYRVGGKGKTMKGEEDKSWEEPGQARSLLPPDEYDDITPEGRIELENLRQQKRQLEAEDEKKEEQPVKKKESC